LRFVSHHDLMRIISRLARRAELPLRYSRGFNPRATISLSVPRSVGVTGLDEIMVIALVENMTGGDICARLNRTAPRGLIFMDGFAIEGRKSIHARKVAYEMDAPADIAGDLGPAVESLKAREPWPVERPVKTRRRTKADTRTIDIKPMVESIRYVKGCLSFVLIPNEERWARPAEILSLLGLDGRLYTPRLRRTVIMDDGDEKN
jgi:radical SAM-linked protein